MVVCFGIFGVVPRLESGCLKVLVLVPEFPDFFSKRFLGSVNSVHGQEVLW